MAGSSTAVRNGAFSFRVSDVVDVPLRGTMLRLRLVDGTPTMKALAVGSTLVLRNGAGAERRVRIVAHAAASGFARQSRLERARELDVIVTPEGEQPGMRIAAEIGWTAHAPA